MIANVEVLQCFQVMETLFAVLRRFFRSRSRPCVCVCMRGMGMGLQRRRRWWGEAVATTKKYTQSGTKLQPFSFSIQMFIFQNVCRFPDVIEQAWTFPRIWVWIEFVDVPDLSKHTQLFELNNVLVWRHALSVFVKGQSCRVDALLPN